MNRRFLIFLTVFCGVLFLGGLYVNLRLATSAAWSAFYAFPFIFVAIGFVRMVTSRAKDRTKPSVLDLFLKRLNFVLMGWLSFLFLTTIARDIIGLVLLGVDSPNSVVVLGEAGSYAALTISVLLLLIGMVPTLRGPSVKKITIPVKNLKSNLEGFKIAQISDLHIGPFIGARYTSQVVEKIRALNPQMVAMTGDIFDSDYEHFHSAARSLGEIPKFAKTFFVSGNHEYYWESAKWFALVEKLGISLLENQNQIFSVGAAKVLVGGVVDPAAQMIGQKQDAKTASIGSADFRILLAHQPQIAETAAQLGFDLQLSGHTHGGQFFPWTLVVKQVHKYHQGLFKVTEKMWIYVTPGTGFWGPPVRLGTTPEITLLTLVNHPER